MISKFVGKSILHSRCIFILILFLLEGLFHLPETNIDKEEKWASTPGEMGLPHTIPSPPISCEDPGYTHTRAQHVFQAIKSNCS